MFKINLRSTIIYLDFSASIKYRVLFILFILLLNKNKIKLSIHRFMLSFCVLESKEKYSNVELSLKIPSDVTLVCK